MYYSDYFNEYGYGYRETLGNTKMHERAKTHGQETGWCACQRCTIEDMF